MAIYKEKNILFAVLNFGKDTSIYKYDLTTSKTIIKYNFIGFTGCYTNITNITEELLLISDQYKGCIYKILLPQADEDPIITTVQIDEKLQISPTGMSIQGANFWVVDYENHRIQKFSIVKLL